MNNSINHSLEPAPAARQQAASHRRLISSSQQQQQHPQRLQQRTDDLMTLCTATQPMQASTSDVARCDNTSKRKLASLVQQVDDPERLKVRAML